MKIRMLIGQRKESYAGEYGPELLAAVDEYVDADAPNYFPQKCATRLEALGDDLVSHAYITVELPDGAVDRLLRPPAANFKAEVVE